MGSPLRGRGQIVLDRNGGFVSPFGSGTLVSSWLDIPPLSAGICSPCHSGCVAWWSSMCPYCWVPLGSPQGSSRSLVRGLGWSFVPYPLFCRLGLVPRSVAQLCALLPLVPSFRVSLSLLCAPLAVGLLPGSPNQLCPLSADCLLGLEPSPSGVASASDGRFSWHPGAAGALAVPSLWLRASESSSLSAWSFPFRGLWLFSRVCSSVGGHVGVAHSFLPSLLLGGSLVHFCGGLCWRSLAMSWACPPPFICVGLLVSSRRIVAPLAPCLSGRFPSLVRVSLLRRGVSPGVGSVGALGELRWLSLYRLTPDLYGLLLFAGCLGCSGRCFLFIVRHSARIHGDHLVSFTDSCVFLARHPRMGLFLGHLHRVWLVGHTVLLHALPGLCHLRWLLVTTVRSSYRMRKTPVSLPRLRWVWPLAIAVCLVVFTSWLAP